VATPPNAAQAERWGGAGGCHWIEHEGAYDRQLEPFGVALLTGAALEPHERVLDVGCGTGTTALTAAATADRVLGIDLSALLVERARARAEGRRNVEFQVADAQTAQLPDPFDVVISRFGVMFFDDPPSAFANLRRAVAPSGGRLAAVCWQGSRAQRLDARPGRGARPRHAGRRPRAARPTRAVLPRGPRRAAFRAHRLGMA
jgi:SAM-dependent methyltransferase